MALFKDVVEAFIASKEFDQASLSRLAYWTDVLGEKEVATITSDDVDAALVKLAERGRLKAGNRPTEAAGAPMAGSTLNPIATHDVTRDRQLLAFAYEFTDMKLAHGDVVLQRLQAVVVGIIGYMEAQPRAGELPEKELRRRVAENEELYQRLAEARTQFYALSAIAEVERRKALEQEQAALRKAASEKAWQESAKARNEAAAQHWSHDYLAKAYAATTPTKTKIGWSRLRTMARRLAATDGIDSEKRDEISEYYAREFLKKARAT